jgi:hypothetical protein
MEGMAPSTVVAEERTALVAGGRGKLLKSNLGHVARKRILFLL